MTNEDRLSKQGLNSITKKVGRETSIKCWLNVGTHRQWWRRGVRLSSRVRKFLVFFKATKRLIRGDETRLYKMREDRNRGENTDLNYWELKKRKIKGTCQAQIRGLHASQCLTRQKTNRQRGKGKKWSVGVERKMIHVEYADIWESWRWRHIRGSKRQDSLTYKLIAFHSYVHSLSNLFGKFVTLKIWLLYKSVRQTKKANIFWN